MEGLLVEIFDIRLFRQPFRLGQFPIGFQPVVANSASDGPARLTLGQFLALVSALHADILMLYLMDFPVGEQQDFLNGAAGRVGLHGRRRLVPHFPAHTGLGPAAGLVKDLFPDLHGFLGDSGPCRIQPVGLLVGFSDVLLQLRCGAFFLGELQAGGRAGSPAALRLNRSHLFRRLFFGPALPPPVGPFQHLFSRAARFRGGKILFSLPVGDIDFLAGGLIFQYHTVTGHALCHLVTGFQILPAHTPPSTTSESRVVIILYSSVLLGMGLVKGKITFSKMRSPAPGSELSMYF